MCECTQRINERLGRTGHQLSMGFAINSQTGEVSAYLLVKTERATLPATVKKGPCPAVPVRFCPFCGEKAL